jgi:nucleotide-binding universal stress UspA family protein
MKILVSTDGSEISAKAIAAAAGLAKALGASLVGMTAVANYEYGGYADYGSEESFDALDFDAVQSAQANDRLAVVEQAARAAGLPYELTMSRKGPPWRAILACARAMDCAIIVLASHGRGGLGALLLGSETQKVLAHADRPVLVVR